MTPPPEGGRDRHYWPAAEPPDDRIAATQVIPTRSAPKITMPPPQSEDQMSLRERANAIFGELAPATNSRRCRRRSPIWRRSHPRRRSLRRMSPTSTTWSPVPCRLVRWVAATHNHTSGSYAANSTTGNVAGSSGSTVVSLNPAPATYKPSTPTSLSNSLAPVDYTPIIVDRRGVVKKLRWRVGNDANVFSIEAYYMALCVYNPATLSIEKVWDSGNIKDGGVANTNSLREVGVDSRSTRSARPARSCSLPTSRSHPVSRRRPAPMRVVRRPAMWPARASCSTPGTSAHPTTWAPSRRR